MISEGMPGDKPVWICRWRQKQLSKKERGKKAKDLDAQLPVNGQYFSTLLGVTSEAYADALGSFIRSNPADINIVQSRKAIHSSPLSTPMVQKHL